MSSFPTPPIAWIEYIIKAPDFDFWLAKHDSFDFSSENEYIKASIDPQAWLVKFQRFDIVGCCFDHSYGEIYAIELSKFRSLQIKYKEFKERQDPIHQDVISLWFTHTS